MRERSLELAGGPEQLAADLKRFGEDSDYIYDHLEEWRELYPDKLVAVFNLQVVAVADTADEMREVLRRDNVPFGRSAIKFIERVPRLHLHFHYA